MNDKYRYVAAPAPEILASEVLDQLSSRGVSVPAPKSLDHSVSEWVG